MKELTFFDVFVELWETLISELIIWKEAICLLRMKT